MVAMVCPSKQGDPVDRLFHNQYLSSSGKWATDFDHKATCTTDKVEILEYCKKVSELLLLRSSPSSRGLEERRGHREKEGLTLPNPKCKPSDND